MFIATTLVKGLNKTPAFIVYFQTELNDINKRFKLCVCVCSICMYLYVCAHVCSCVCICMCLCVYAHVCIYVYVCVSMCEFMHLNAGTCQRQKCKIPLELC